jgi:pyruvate dehydrogenase E1 component
MFGFQRVGDAIWAAADQRARGFLLGATSGRTTLGGEGLQHQDGSSHLVAATIPNCKAYDPAFACELSVILDRGIREMVIEQRDFFYYITLMNENYAQPELLENSEENIIRGCYKYKTLTPQSGSIDKQVTLMGSGAIMTEVVKAAAILLGQGITVHLFSVTSWSELARDGKAHEKIRLTGSEIGATEAFISKQLLDSQGLIIAATDYVCAIPESIRAFIPEGRKYITLGTDGFGRSDTRAALRSYFGVDAATIAKAACP